MALTIRIANFNGRCGYDCGRMIHEGDDIVRVDDEWCHATCAEDDGHEVRDA